MISKLKYFSDYDCLEGSTHDIKDPVETVSDVWLLKKFYKYWLGLVLLDSAVFWVINLIPSILLLVR